jgi:hypothetical protein
MPRPMTRLPLGADERAEPADFDLPLEALDPLLELPRPLLVLPRPLLALIPPLVFFGIADPLVEDAQSRAHAACRDDCAELAGASGSRLASVLLASIASARSSFNPSR